ncbi:MAG: efflux RND transporter periplasmic adaptor subunit [Sphingomonadales bacterium]|nr:efflux RND transporter periplasmic adaptor subunit [Sphingomonadales bacterium]MDE2569807.1 efflux RND transporter periplasmic adaptor subunit [Sphingomonadales bacterium]
MNYETSIGAGGTRPEDPLAVDIGGEDAPSNRIWWIAGVVLALLAIGGYIYSHRQAAGGSAAASAGVEQVVTVVSPGRTSVSKAVVASGSLAARRELPVGIAGEGGKVVSVLVDAGDWVKAGQVLAVVDRSVQSEQIVAQSANVSVADANARLAQANLDRAEKLVDRGFISKADIDKLTATRDGAVAQVRVAQATLGQLRASAARLNVVAPNAGLVLTRGIEPGQVIGPGTGVLFSIAKDGEMEMQAHVSEADLAAMTVGENATVVPVGSQQTFTGQIWQVAPTVNKDTREGVVRIALAYNPALRPGGFATATIRSGRVDAPLLPESAILSDSKGSYVFVVGKDNKVERRDVATGVVTENGIAVVRGLTGSERVVLRAGGFLNPGDKIKPVAAKAGSEG